MAIQPGNQAAPAGDSDGQLLSRAGRGDRAALSSLYVRHRDRLRLLIRCRLGRGLRRRLESEDVLQSAFVRAVQRFSGEPLPERHFLGWIVRAIDNTLRDRARRLGAKKRSAAAAEAGIDEDVLDPNAATPSADARCTEDLAALQSAMDRLSQRDRELILLTKIEGRTAAEAGAVLGLGAESAQRAVTRALVRLAGQMR